MNKEKKIGVVIRLTEKEHELAKVLAEYLHKNDLIDKPTMNNTFRYSLVYLAYAIEQNAKNANQVDNKDSN